MTSHRCDLFVFVGEKSGDLHGEKLLHELRTKNPHLTISGVGGPRMRSQGMQCTLPMEEFQVMGFIDVLLALPKLIYQFYFIASAIKRLQPKAVVTIDYPGFNLRLAKHLRKKGFEGKLIHYICPSVWAWGKKRIPLIAKNYDLLLSILPFEKQLFAETPLNVAFVGHPLTERVQDSIDKPLSLPAPGKIIALFPGSRKKEITRNLPLCLDVCRALQEHRGDLRAVLCVSDKQYLPMILTIMQEKGWNENALDFVFSDKSHALMKVAHLAIAKSGTVTLELALHRVPTVVIYGVSRLDKIIAYDILRIRLPYYCLVNIIAKTEVFPEFIGPNFTFERVRAAAEELLTEPARLKQQAACDGLIQQLGDHRTSAAAATEILNLI